MASHRNFSFNVLKTMKLLFSVDKGSNITRLAAAEEQGLYYYPISAKKDNALIDTYKAAIAAIEITMQHLLNNGMVDYLLNFDLNNKQEQVDDFPCDYTPLFVQREVELPEVNTKNFEQQNFLVKATIDCMVSDFAKSLILTKDDKSCDWLFTVVYGDPTLVRLAYETCNDSACFPVHDVRMENKLFLIPVLRDQRTGNYRSVFQIQQEPPTLHEMVTLRGPEGFGIPTVELCSELIYKVVTTLPVLGRIDVKFTK